MNDHERGATYENPKAGCYDAPDGPGGLEIGNFTNKEVTVFDEPKCAGETVTVVEPGNDADVFGASVRIG
ncbi:hypothetical protein [Streptomyces sp. NPDC051567]|uniref:hypothetical protein n=1 Tax=Streptomyces sp. NPDC051567 TaxID=3365660 RepID=UPI0037A51385